jgi:hypothetical protein
MSIPRSLKYFMLKNYKVDFLGNSEVAFFYTPCIARPTVIAMKVTTRQFIGI